MPRSRALGVEHDQVVHHHPVAESDLVRVAQHHALAEDDTAPHRAEEKRVEQLPQDQAQGAGHPGRDEHHQLVEHQAADAPASDHEVLVFAKGRLALTGNRVLDARGAGPAALGAGPDGV